MRRTSTDQVDPESVTRPSTVLGPISRYDLIMGVIPLAFLASGISAMLSDLPLELLVGAGSVVCLLAMVDALYLNPPVVDDDRDRERSEHASRQQTGR